MYSYPKLYCRYISQYGVLLHLYHRVGGSTFYILSGLYSLNLNFVKVQVFGESRRFSATATVTVIINEDAVNISSIPFKKTQFLQKPLSSICHW